MVRKTTIASETPPKPREVTRKYERFSDTELVASTEGGLSIDSIKNSGTCDKPLNVPLYTGQELPDLTFAYFL